MWGLSGLGRFRVWKGVVPLGVPAFQEALGVWLLKGFKPAGCEALGPTCGLRVDGMGGFLGQG